MFTVNDLEREQLIELKQQMLTESDTSVSWGELADADDLIPDEDVFSRFAGVEFSTDDFFSLTNKS